MSANAKKWKKRKFTRLVPREALFVSLTGVPSAKASRHVIIRKKGDPDPDGSDSVLMFRSQRSADPEIGTDEMQIHLHAKIERVDRARRVVYAQVYNAPWDPDPNSKVTEEEIKRHVDTYDTFMTQEDIQFLAHRFLEVSRAVDVEHDEIAGAGTPVESFIVRSDDGKGWGYPGGRWEERAWVMGTRIDEDDEWAKVERGIDDPEATTDVIRGYSLSAIVKKEARYVLVEDTEEKVARVEESPVVAEPGPTVAPGLLAKVLRSLGLGALLKDDAEEPEEEPKQVDRAEEPVVDFATAWKAEIAEKRVNTARWTLHRVMNNILISENIADKPAALGKAIDQFKAAILSTISKSEVTMVERSAAAEKDPLGLMDALYVEERVGRKVSAARRKKIETAVTALLEIIAEVDANVDNVTETRAEDEMTPEKLEEIVRAAVAAGNQSIVDRLDRVERAQSLANGETEETLAVRAKMEGLDADLIERAVAGVKAAAEAKAKEKAKPKGSDGETVAEVDDTETAERSATTDDNVEERIKRAVDAALTPFAGHIEGMSVTLKAVSAENKALKTTQPAAGSKVTRADQQRGTPVARDAAVEAIENDPTLSHEERRAQLKLIDAGEVTITRTATEKPWYEGRFSNRRAQG